MPELVRDKVIRKFIDRNANKYVIYKKTNNHYRLVKFSGNQGIIVATTKIEIFNYLGKIYKEDELQELLNKGE